MNDVMAYLQGESGGAMAICFMSGAAMGYAFAQKTVIAEARRRITRLEDRIEELTNNQLGIKKQE